MKISILFFACLFALLSTETYAQKELRKIMVNQEWMQQHADDKNLVLLHVGDSTNYVAGHIENSQFINASDFARVVGNLYWELPIPEVLNENLRNRGITKKSKIVLIHGGQDHAATFRLYYTLDYFGLAKNAVILDGGLKGWKARKLPITAKVPVVRAAPDGSLPFKLNAAIKVDKDYMKSHALKDEVNLIDARRAKYFEGAKETQEHYDRSGHIPGAENICWLDIVDENLFMKDIATLRAFYESAGVEKKEQVVAYCHVGLRASVIYTVAKGLGYSVKLYDGSYNEWDKLSDAYPVKQGKASK